MNWLRKLFTRNREPSNAEYNTNLKSQFVGGRITMGEYLERLRYTWGNDGKGPGISSWIAFVDGTKLNTYEIINDYNQPTETKMEYPLPDGFEKYDTPFLDCKPRDYLYVDGTIRPTGDYGYTGAAIGWQYAKPLTPKPPKVWPSAGDWVWYATTALNKVDQYQYGGGHPSDDIGNYFRTRDQAETALKLCNKAIAEYRAGLEGTKGKRWTVESSEVGKVNLLKDGSIVQRSNFDVLPRLKAHTVHTTHALMHKYRTQEYQAIADHLNASDE